MSRIKVGLAALAVGAVAIALVPALSSGGLGDLVAKDVGKGNSPLAVATATIPNPGKLTFTIATKPRRKKVAWLYTTDCVKDGKKYEYPPPGQAEDTVSRSKVRKTMNKVVDNPDSCTVAVSGKMDFKAGKKITAKIFNKR
jgi:hypothetical protein